MCAKNELNKLLESLAKQAKDVAGAQFDEAILYGSYARGDFDDESDIDVFIKINCNEEELRTLKKKFVSVASRLSLEYGVEVSVSLSDSETYQRFKNHLPYFENIEKEGVKIA